jgi:outer membrane receptor protein involved in Fe transport
VRALSFLLLCIGAVPSHGGEHERGLADLSLEERANVVVTSVSRHDERLSVAAASIYVISAEDIRRSGARTLPEALRLAPNLQVARASAGTYAISSRGFNNSVGNKLLVLIDGRTVYTPLFSGVFRDQQDVMLEDVARFEVISGPGATLWGANAVNGIINVITSNARSTVGALLAAGAGNRDRLVWGAVSRAVRAPARLDRDFSLVFTPFNLAIIRGGPYFEAEIAKVFELGYRTQPSAVLSYSITAFRHVYDKLRSGMPAPAFIQNEIAGFANGVEGWAAFQPVRRWRLSGGFSTLHQHLGVKPGSTDPTGPSALGNDPDHQWLLRSSFTLDAGHEFDLLVRRIGLLPLQIAGTAVPAYTAVDARWGWRINRNVELSLALHNLFDRAHAEFDSPGTRGDYRRSVLQRRAA